MKQPVIPHVKKTVAACAFSLVLLHTFAQADSSLALLHQFDIYRKQVLQEKLFVHTDKSVYFAGEILWFKIYNVDAFFHMPLDISSVAYVEILDKNNKSLLQAKLALNKGDGNGSIFLPVNLNSGNYKLRAYTNWMKNFAPDYFFEKPVTIINSQKITDTISQQKIVKYDIGFFPEGGNLVNAIQSKVAFRIADQYGKGIDCDGILIDDNNDTILAFRPFKFGIGNFSFTPATYHTYKAVIIFTDGRKVVKELPRAYDNGYVMHLEHIDNGQLEITVRQPAGTGGDAGQLTYLFIHTRGSIKWVGSKAIQNGMAAFLVDCNKLGDGISQLTVFNKDKQPVCERLYFSYPKKKLQVAIHTDQPAYECRKKVNIDIFSGGQDGKPRQADLSLAVYRLDSLQTLDGINIDNYLWLTSDLGGGIESPDYYFKNKGLETEEAMDNLMLTHGWRRFKWEDVLQDRKPTFRFVPEYNGHIISGKITDGRTGLPGKKIDGFLSVPGTGIQFRNAISNSQGRIKFEMKNFYGSQEIIVQTNTQQDSGYRVDISSPFVDQYSANPLPYFSLPEKNLHSLLYGSINTQVQNLYVGNKLQQFRMPMTDSVGFYAPPDEKYLLDDYTRFTTLEEIITEYVLAVNISKRAGKFHLVVTNRFTKQKFDNDPLVLIDGVPVFDIDKFMTNVDPLKINKLEVVERKYFFGYQSFDGILNFTTYKGDLAGYELDPHAIATDYEGLQLQRKFYSPRYETEELSGSHLPDFRNLLFWAPEIKTNIYGKQEEGFYTSDLPGRFAIMVQGLDASGMTGSQVLLFDVKSRTK